MVASRHHLLSGTSTRGLLAAGKPKRWRWSRPCAIPVRVSSDSQDVNNSVEAQIAECEAFAKSYNIIVIRIYIDEAESGLISNRPEFQQMVYDALSKKKPYDVILVWKLSRFSRDKLDNALYKSRLQSGSVRIISIKEPIDNSPAGQMMENMIESMDAFYSANLSQDVRRGQRQVALRGYYPGNRAPYGYKLKKVQEEGGKAFHNIFVADEPYNKIVRCIILEAGAGKSANEIRAGLNQGGIPAPKGGLWADSTIHQMCHNLHYAGLIVWGTSGDPPIIAPGKHKPIVSEEEMQLAIEVLASKFHTVVNPRQTASDYMMSRMLRCRLCGKPLTVRYDREKGQGYYVCKARKEDGLAGCELPYVNIEKFDKKFLEVMLADILAPGNIKAAIDQIANELSGPIRATSSDCLGPGGPDLQGQGPTGPRDGSLRGRRLHGDGLRQAHGPAAQRRGRIGEQEEKCGTPTRPAGCHHRPAGHSPRVRQRRRRIHQALHAQGAQAGPQTFRQVRLDRARQDKERESQGKDRVPYPAPAGCGQTQELGTRNWLSEKSQLVLLPF